MGSSMKFGAGSSGAIQATLVRLLEIQMDERVVDIQMDEWRTYRWTSGWWTYRWKNGWWKYREMDERVVDSRGVKG